MKVNTYTNYLSGISENTKILQSDNNILSILEILTYHNINVISIYNEIKLPVNIDITDLNINFKESLTTNSITSLSFYGKQEVKEYTFTDGSTLDCIPSQNILIEYHDKYIWKAISSVRLTDKIISFKDNKLSYLYKNGEKTIISIPIWSLKSNKLSYYILDNGMVLQ